VAALGGLEAHSARFVATGRLALSTKLGTPLNDDGLLLGASLESRGEVDLGSRWESGVMLGWGSGPAAIGGRVGFEAYGEFGTPLYATLFRRGDLYAGAALSVPIHFGSPRHVVDLNESTWVLTRRFEIVPLLRTRLHRDRTVAGATLWRTDLSLGVSLRLRMFSDLF
jgi:hypothetical protein